MERGQEHSQQDNCVLHPGEGDGNSPRYACLENPVDRGAHGLRGRRESDVTRRLKHGAAPTGDKAPLRGLFYGRDSVSLGQTDAKVGGLCHGCHGPAEEAEDQ